MSVNLSQISIPPWGEGPARKRQWCQRLKANTEVATRELVKLFIEIPGLGLSIRCQSSWESQRMFILGKLHPTPAEVTCLFTLWDQSEVGPLFDGLNCGSRMCAGMWMRLCDGVTLTAPSVHHYTAQWLVGLLVSQPQRREKSMCCTKIGMPKYHSSLISVSSLLCPRMSAV